MSPIYQSPDGLLASRETWEAVVAEMTSKRAKPVMELRREAHGAIQSAINITPEGQAVRVKLPPETEAAVLRLAATLG